MRKTGIREARRFARNLVHQLGISAPEHVRIEAIAKRKGARVVETRLEGAQAQLVKTPDGVQIMVSDRIVDVRARRFSIAHELGHYLLGHPSMPPHMLSAAVAAPAARDDRRDYEAEANAFASELLMPYALVRVRCEASPVTLDIAWRIAQDFNVSILSSARRLAELSPERIAAVFSAERRVVWVAPSETFTREIERGQRVDPGSVAWDFFMHGKIDERAQPVPADAWFDTAADVDVIEHSTAHVELRTVLSLLWVPESVAAPLGMST